MTDEFVFYTNPPSRGRIVCWMLDEVGQPYRAEILDYAAMMKEPAFAAINPMTKVPAIVHNGVTVTETAAICAYLADAFPEAGLAPPLADRGAYYRWLFLPPPVSRRRSPTRRSASFRRPRSARWSATPISRRQSTRSKARSRA